MKKFINLLFVLIIGIVFVTGCSFGPKPESTVSNFIDAGKKFDLTQMATMVNPADAQKVTDMTKGKDSKAETDQYQQYFMDYFKDNASKITYTIKGTKVEKDNATVTVDFKYVDGGPLLKATLGDVFSKAISLAFTGVQVKDDEMGQMLVSSMAKQKETIKETTAEKTIDISLSKIDNKWLINKPSDELLDVFMSNFISVGNEINKSMNSGTNANKGQMTFMEQAKKDNKTIITKAIGDEIPLATIIIKVNSAQEQANITAQYSSPKVAKDGAKFLVVNLDITNTTNKAFTFDPQLLIVDDKGREFKTYDSIGAIDNYLNYKELSPSIKETGNLATNFQKMQQAIISLLENQDQTRSIRLF